jgi:hypothetical protein
MPQGVLNFTTCSEQMEKLSIVLLLLFGILFIGQYYTREYFTATDGATVTMSLTDLLYYSGGLNSTAATAKANASAISPSTSSGSPSSGSPSSTSSSSSSSRSSSSSSSGSPSSSSSGSPSSSSSSSPLPYSDLDTYLFLKNEMTKEFKDHLRKSGRTMHPTNVEHPSIDQGSSYLESVPLVASKCQ